MPYRSTFGRVFSVEMGIALAVAAVIAVVLVLSLVRRRASRVTEASQRSEWTSVEASYVVLLIGVATFLSWLSISADHHQKAAAATRPAVTVNVTAYQWCWRFGYQGTGIQVGGTCNQGRDLPTMVVPVNRPVRINLTSADVVHEWWVPYLRQKMEVLPDHVNSLQINLTSTGRWIGRCSEYCGINHLYMHFYLRAVTPSEYQRWVQSQHGAAVT